MESPGSTFSSHARQFIACISAAMASIAAGQACAAASVGDVFVIALENHNFTQPSSDTSPQQISGNSAAPYINSLITSGNTNAAQVSYATEYYNSGTGVHPSEPNYIWSEAGTNYNPGTSTTVLADNDPSAPAGNIFTNVPHLTGLMNAAGVSWKNYQEDVQYSTSPLVSVSGNGGTAPSGVTVTTNPYNGTKQYGYAVKHNPMAFFSDTATENVYALSQLQTDLNNNTVGKYNWITPDLYNDMHTALSTSFTYHGTTYTAGTDQEAVAVGDNFLSIIVPEIMASQAYQNNGAIIIWNDETEGGDTSSCAMTEIVISPLAKGNAYASSVPMSHSSDLKTMEENFQLGPYLNNSIPSSETAVGGGYNRVASVNDLSDLFKTGAIPASSGTATTFSLSWDSDGVYSNGATDGSGTWNTSAKWYGAGPNDVAWPNAAGDTAQFGAGSGSSIAYTVSLSASTSLGGLIFQNQAYTLTGSTLNLIGATPTVTVNASGGTIGSAITSAGGPTKTGSGELYLAGANTYTGTTTVSTGTLALGPSAVLATSAVNVSAGSVFTVPGGAALSGSPAMNASGTVDFNLAAQTISSLNGLSGGIVALNGTALTVANGGTFAGSLQNSGGTGSLTVSGGNLILSGSDSFTGGTTVTRGELTLDDAGALADGSSLAVGLHATSFFAPVAGPADSAALAKVASAPEPGTLILLIMALWSAIVRYPICRCAAETPMRNSKRCIT